MLESILHKVHRDFNISLAEVDHQELHQVSLIGFGFVGGDKILLEKKIAHLLACMENFPGVEVVDHRREIQKIDPAKMPQAFEEGKYAV